MANFAAVRTPPPRLLFGNISAKNQATKQALEPNWQGELGVGRRQTAEQTGGPTTKAETAVRR